MFNHHFNADDVLNRQRELQEEARQIRLIREARRARSARRPIVPIVVAFLTNLFQK